VAEVGVDDDDTPQTLVGVSFDNIFRAREFMTVASRLKAENELVLHDVVLIVKDDDGKTTVTETVDPQPRNSAISGAMWAGLFGLLLGGPVGWAAGAAVGAGAGIAAAKVIDLGVSDEWVSWFRAAVMPGTATVVLLVSELHTEALLREARRFPGSHLVYANVDDGLLDRLAEAFGPET
jgi:uncharacterized membrane protein